MPLFETIHEFQNAIIIGEPGAGKSTFLQYLAIIHANSLLQNTTNNVTLKYQSRLPILIPLKELTLYIKPIQGCLTEDIIFDFLYQIHNNDNEIKVLIKDYLKQGKCILMFDGLDEITSDKECKTICQLINKLSNKNKANKYIITSRPIAVEVLNRITLPEKIIRTNIVPLSLSESECFIKKWASAIPTHSTETNQKIDTYVNDLNNSPQLQRLLKTPYLLVISFILLFRSKELKEKTNTLYDVYERYLKFLLEDCEDNFIRPVLNCLQYIAFKMQEKDINIIDYNTLEEYIIDFCKKTSHTLPPGSLKISLIYNITRRPGILRVKQSGVLVQRYTFSHETIPEFLTAYYISQHEDLFDLLIKKLETGKWRNILLFTATCHFSESTVNGISFVDKILSTKFKDSNLSNLELAAECLLESPEIEYPQKEVLLNRKKQDIQDKAIAFIEKPGSEVNLRVRIGNLLGKMNDPRCNNIIPEMIEIPSGTFNMGTTEKELEEIIQLGIKERVSGGLREYEENIYKILKELYKREAPLRIIELDSFRIAKYPITNLQYKYFIDEGGYNPPHHDEEWAEPYNWSGNMYPPVRANHPVVLIKYEDAVAYCEWLNKKATEKGKMGKFRLPTEAEWERAARGPYKNLEGVVNKRSCPWGNEVDEKRCNIAASRFNQTIPVGIYDDGKSIEGVQDMIGNVWEWTSTIYGRGWDQCEYPYPYNKFDGREDSSIINDEIWKHVVRGGSWSSDRSRARCSYRTIDVPGTRNRLSVGFRIAQSI